jgi:hypothetical protein
MRQRHRCLAPKRKSQHRKPRIFVPARIGAGRRRRQRARAPIRDSIALPGYRTQVIDHGVRRRPDRHSPARSAAMSAARFLRPMTLIGPFAGVNPATAAVAPPALPSPLIGNRRKSGGAAPQPARPTVSFAGTQSRVARTIAGFRRAKRTSIPPYGHIGVASKLIRFSTFRKASIGVAPAYPQKSLFVRIRSL